MPSIHIDGADSREPAQIKHQARGNPHAPWRRADLLMLIAASRDSRGDTLRADSTDQGRSTGISADGGTDAFVDDPILICASCSTLLTGSDPDEDPTGDAGMPICGNCAREREFFVMDMVDGVEDGNMDPDR